MSCKLNDVCELIVDCPHSTEPDEGEGYPIIRTPNIGVGYLDLEGVQRVSKAAYDRRNVRAVPRPNDLILAREAPAGNVGIIREGMEVCLGQRTVLIRPNAEKVSPLFLNYYLNAPKQRHALLSNSNGATVSHVNMPVIRNLVIELPDREAQDRIADVLSAYDELIENNRRQIKLLEEAAQRFYKEWFIDLKFPGHETTPIVDGLPEGWEAVHSSEAFKISIGKTPPRKEPQWFTETGVPWASVADLGKCDAFILRTAECLTDEAIERYNVKMVPANTILISFKMTIGRVAIAPFVIATNEAIAHFVCSNKLIVPYAFEYFRNFEYTKLGSTSSIATAINSKIVKTIPFVLPSQQLIEMFGTRAWPLLELIRACQQKMLAAREARDRLLPKLMSGEIEVQ